jgi:YbbR domain-containing protein
VNADGEEVEATHVTADVDVVNVTVPVSVLKELEVSVDILSGGGAHAWDCDIDIRPKRVTLSGTVEELAVMDRLNVGSINLAEHAEDFEMTFPIELDEGIECVTGETEVRVSVRFKDLVIQDFEVTDLRYINCADTIRASIVNKTLPVTIRAEEATMAKITAGDIRVIADLADYGTMTGYVTVPVKIYVDGVTGAGAVGEYSVTVNLTSK